MSSSEWRQIRKDAVAISKFLLDILGCAGGVLLPVGGLWIHMASDEDEVKNRRDVLNSWNPLRF